MPGVSSSRCHAAGRQPAKHRPRGRPGPARSRRRRGAPTPGSVRGTLRAGRSRPAWWRRARCRARAGRWLPFPSRWPRSAAAARSVAAGRAWRRTARSPSSARPDRGQDRGSPRRSGRRPRRRRAGGRSRAAGGAPRAPRPRHSRTCRSPRRRDRADRSRWGRDEDRTATRGDRSHVTANWAVGSRSAARPGLSLGFYIRTPRPMRCA